MVTIFCVCVHLQLLSVKCNPNSVILSMEEAVTKCTVKEDLWIDLVHPAGVRHEYINSGAPGERQNSLLSSSHQALAHPSAGCTPCVEAHNLRNAVVIHSCPLVLPAAVHCTYTHAHRSSSLPGAVVLSLNADISSYHVIRRGFIAH